MKSKTFVMLFLAIGCGLVAAYLTARITAKQATPETVPVLVAKEKIKAGDVIKDPEEWFVVMHYPAGATPNAITNLEDLKEKMVNKTIQPGQWVTPEDVSSNFGIELPKGHYAMAVKVDAASAAGGFVLPKSRVNVVATIRPVGGQGRPKVVTILQDILVLAVDTISNRPEDTQAIGGLSTALLAVTPADSQKLTLAQEMGTLRLALRPHDDEEKPALRPLDQLDTDLGFNDRPAETTAPTYQLVVAKQDLEAGTLINDPTELFEVKSFTEVPEKALTPEGLMTLKGQALKVPLFKDNVLTAKHFDEKMAGVVVQPKPEPKKHLLFIQNGGKAPEVTTYLQAKAGDEDRGTFQSAPPAEKPTAPPEPAKPSTGTGEPSAVGETPGA